MAEVGGAVSFLIFYVVFLGLAVYFQGLIGQDILTESTDIDMSNISASTPTTSVNWWTGLFHMTSEYPELNILLFSPLIIVGIYILIVSLIP